MQISTDICPICMKAPIGTVENVPGIALLVADDEEPGQYEYAGETEMSWDGQRTHRPIGSVAGHLRRA